MKVGQIVYVKKVGNSARYCKEDELISEEVVEKVGNKYFYLKHYTRVKFSIERMCDVSEYSYNYNVYLTRQEIEDETERDNKLDAIKREFSRYGKMSDISLEVIRQIYTILKLEDKK